MCKKAPAPMISEVPELAAMFNDDFNRVAGLNADTLSSGSGKQALFDCPDCTYTFNAQVCNVMSAIRRGKTGCSGCAGKVATPFNSLGALFPELAEELYDDLDPNDLTQGSRRVVRWKCKAKGHIWHAPIANRTSKSRRGCPMCAKRTKLISKTHPRIMAEMVRPEDAYEMCGRDRRFKCEHGHIYTATVYERIKGQGCKVCEKLEFATTKSVAALLPEIASKFAPTCPVKPEEVGADDREARLIMVCDRGHHYHTTLSAELDGVLNCDPCSRGNSREASVALYLSQQGAIFETEKMFPGLHGESGVPYRYDFAILRGDRAPALIEVHAHDLHGTNLGIISRDLVKEAFAEEHGLPLLVIDDDDLNSGRMRKMIDSFLQEAA